MPGSWPPVDPSEQGPSTGLTDIFKEDLEEVSICVFVLLDYLSLTTEMIDALSFSVSNSNRRNFCLTH